MLGRRNKSNSIDWRLEAMRLSVTFPTAECTVPSSAETCQQRRLAESLSKRAPAYIQSPKSAVRNPDGAILDVK